MSGGTPEITVRGTWGDVVFVACGTCGSWCQHPQITPASLAAWYDSDEYQGSARRPGTAYVDYLADEASRSAEARRRYRRDLAPFLPVTGARVLEVGCATGSVLAVIREAGHQVVGIDLSRRFAEAARMLYGLDVRVGDVLEAEWAEGTFDMALLLGTVSNLGDVPGTLSTLRRLLKSGGTLVLNFPNAQSLVARLYGSRFWMFVPSANTFMTERGCRAALANAGFTVRRSRTDRQKPSVAKLVNHARLGALVAWLQRAGLGRASAPFAFPVPGVRIVWATPAAAGSEGDARS